MKIQQLFYTSCRKGFSSGSGFQTYSMSKGISDEERKEIETYCVYIPPDNLPTQPTEEEIEKLFPISFSYFKLKNGKYCISQAKYIGRDYSGRYGNYFCHVLIFNEPISFYPMDIYKSIIFKDKLTLEEENLLQIKYLPELELKDIQFSNIISFDTISRFLKQNDVENRRKIFKNLINSVIEYNSNNKKISFYDKKENVCYLIGAVHRALPKKIAMKFTFTTYTYSDENSNYILCASYKNESKILNEVKKEDNKSSFIKLSDIGYTVSKSVFLPFIDFLTQFEYEYLNKDIDNAVYLYNMVKKGIAKCDIENIKRAINFAIKYKSIEAYKQLFCELKPNLEKISSQVDIELTEVITKFLFKMGNEVENYEYIENAYKFFFDSIHYLVVDAENIEIEKILTLYKNIRAVSPEEFVEKSLSLLRMKELITYMEGAKVRHAKFYFKSIIYDIIFSNEGLENHRHRKLFDFEDKDNKFITMFLYKCLGIIIKSNEDIIDIFNSFKYKYEYLSKILVTIYLNCLKNNDDLKEDLIYFVLKENDEEWKHKIYLYISGEPKGNDLLFLFYEMQLREKHDNEDFFIYYCKENFDLLLKFREEKFSDALNIYINYCKEENDNIYDISSKECEEILNYIENNSLEKIIKHTVLEKIIIVFEEKINEENIKIDQRIIAKILNIKNKYNIKTPSSTIEILYTGISLEKCKGYEVLKLLKNLKCNFQNIREDRYKHYLKWLLPNICVYLRNDMEHGKVKKILYCSQYSEAYYKEYINVIKDIMDNKYKIILKNLNKESYEIFLDFIVFIFKNNSDIEEQSNKFLNYEIIEILKKVNDKKLVIYESYVKGSLKNYKNGYEVMIKWRDVKRRASNKGKGTLFKIKNIFD